jgi:DNA topoisomerase I
MIVKSRNARRRTIYFHHVRVTRKTRTRAFQPAPPVDPVESAKAARLRYTTDNRPGIRRKRAGKGFYYLGSNGKPIRDRAELRRIQALAIPPAWTDVWISPIPEGHLQATGRDARGRKQYRYHRRWRETRDETKYERMVAFGEALPGIRRRVERDLSQPGLPRERVLASVVKLMALTFIRVGNPEYARTNNSFGLTTLRDRHVEVSGSKLQFQFRGKGGKSHTIEVTDPRLARIVKRCQDISGYELFQYIDENGKRRKIDSSDVNEYLRSMGGHDFTAKDFRTWAGTVLAVAALKESGRSKSGRQAKKNIVQAIKVAAEQLGNTPAICRKCYVHPLIIESYTSGLLLEKLETLSSRPHSSLNGLKGEEATILAFLREAQAAQAVPLEVKLRQSLKQVRKEKKLRNHEDTKAPRNATRLIAFAARE